MNVSFCLPILVCPCVVIHRRTSFMRLYLLPLQYLVTPVGAHRNTSVDWPAKIYIHQFCMGTRYRLEDLPRAMADRDGCRESQKNPCSWHALMMILCKFDIIVSVFIRNVYSNLFGLVSLFNDISTFVGYLLSKSSLWNNSSGTGCLKKHGTNVTANVLFFVSDTKIVYNSNYQSSITMPWTREEKYFAWLLIWTQNHLKLSENICNDNDSLLRHETQKKKIACCGPI